MEQRAHALRERICWKYRASRHKVFSELSVGCDSSQSGVLIENTETHFRTFYNRSVCQSFFEAVGERLKSREVADIKSEFLHLLFNIYMWNLYKRKNVFDKCIDLTCTLFFLGYGTIIFQSFSIVGIFLDKIRYDVK